MSQKKIPELESYHLGVGSSSHGEQTGEMLKRTGDLLTKEAPDLLFCPTETAVRILGSEGIVDGIYLTGDVMVDALQENIKIAEKNSMILDDLSLKQKEYYLATQKFIDLKIQMLLKS